VTNLNSNNVSQYTIGAGGEIVKCCVPDNQAAIS